MEFPQFDRMTSSGQAEFIAEMVQTTETALRNEGHGDLADKMAELFLKVEEGDLDSLGLVELERNIALAREADLKRLDKDPNARRLDVQDALFVTLKKNGIDAENMPQEVMDAMRNYRVRTAADFVSMTAEQKQQFVKLMVTIAVPDFLFRDDVANRIAKKELMSLDTMKTLLSIAQDRFGSVTGSSQNASGFDQFSQRLETASTQKPDTFAFGVLVGYIFDEQLADLNRQDDDLVKKNADIYDFQSIILSDGRHVLPDRNGDFYVITRSIDDKGQKLEDQFKPEAQRRLDCRKSGRGNDCSE
jgi:hypothetical protein